MHLDSEGAFGRIGLQVDLHSCSVPTTSYQTVSQLLKSVAAVGDEFTDKYLDEQQQRP